jgi:putative MATE family efflux protein
VSYFRIYTAGLTSVVLYNMGAGILQSVGDSRSPMRYLIVASLLNVALDLLFVAGMGYGVGSAALATILSQTVSAVLVFAKLMRCKASYQVRLREIRFDRIMFGKVMALGIPSGVQNSIIALANVVVQSKINTFGDSAMAGCGAYSKVEGFAFLPITCFAMALATFVSQNIGAEKYDRVHAGTKFGILCSTILAESIGVIVYALAPWLVGFFSSNPAVIRYGIGDARTIALFYCLLAFSHCCAGILRGMGRPVVPMLVMLLIWCGLRLTYITTALHFIPKIQVIWWAYPLTWTVSGVIFTVYLLRTRVPGAEKIRAL